MFDLVDIFHGDLILTIANNVADSKYAFKVTVQSRFLPDQSDPTENRYSYAYSVTINNAGNVPAQLISRHWIITDGNNKMVEVKGLGVIGHQPLLKPGESFEYTSGSQIRTPNGSMRGSYFCVAEDGTRFEAPVEEFALVMPRTLH
jgi:ApaG protein